MREARVVTSTWCDMCGEGGGKKADATQSFVVASSRGRRPMSLPRLMDLCDEHGMAYLAWHSLLQTLPSVESAPGSTAKVPAKPTATCPGCFTPMLRSSLIDHIQRSHGVRVSPPKRCPDCGVEMNSPQGMSMHMMRVHDYDTVGGYINALREKIEEHNAKVPAKKAISKVAKKAAVKPARR